MHKANMQMAQNKHIPLYYPSQSWQSALYQAVGDGADELGIKVANAAKNFQNWQ
jgi:hypothetical protein